MKIIRYILVVGSVGWLGFVIYNVMTRGFPRRNDEFFVVGLFVGYVILCLVYCLLSESRGDQSRIARIVSLWFDAKERELRERAGKPPTSP